MNVLLYNTCAVFLLFHLVNSQTAIKSVRKINKCTVKFEDTDNCACSNNARIKCYNRTIWINRCYCMYYDPEKDKSIISNCSEADLEGVHLLPVYPPFV